MAVVYLSPIFNWQNLNVNLSLLANGTLETYEAESSTPLETYTTQAGDVQNQNPIPLDSDGRPPEMIWLISGEAYKFILKDADGNPIGPTFDNITGVNDPETLPSLPSISGYAALPTANGGGTASDITATFSPAVAPVDRLTVIVKSTAANPGAVTFNPNGTGPLPVVKLSNEALEADDIPGGEYYLIMTYNASISKWVLDNPSYVVPDQAFYEGTISVTTTPYSPISANAGKLFYCLAAASEINLPSAATVNNGSTYTIVNYTSSTVHVFPDGADLFLGTNSYNSDDDDVIIPPYACVVFAQATSATWAVTGINGGEFQKIINVIPITAAASFEFIASTLDPVQDIYNRYLIELVGVQPNTDDIEVWALLSSNAGVSYHNNNYYSSTIGYSSAATGVAQAMSGAAQMIIAGSATGSQSLSNAANETALIQLELRNFNTGTSIVPQILTRGAYFEATGAYATASGSGTRSTPADYDAIKFTLEGAGDFAPVGYAVVYKLMKTVQ